MNQAARYELALSYRALGQSALADPILAGLAKEGKRTGRRGCPVPDRPVSPDRRALCRSRPPARSLPGRQPQGRCRRCRAGSSRGGAPGTGPARLTPGRLWPTLAERFPTQPVVGSDTAAACRGRAGRAPGRAGRRAVPAGCRRREVDRTSRARPPGTKSNEPDGSALRVRALAGLGKSLRELGKPADAAAAFAAVLELAPADPIAPEVALAQGRALEADKQLDAALKSYSLVLEKFAKSTRRRKPPWPRLDSSPRPVAAMRRPVRSSV